MDSKKSIGPYSIPVPLLKSLRLMFLHLYHA